MGRAVRAQDGGAVSLAGEGHPPQRQVHLGDHVPQVGQVGALAGLSPAGTGGARVCPLSAFSSHSPAVLEVWRGPLEREAPLPPIVVLLATFSEILTAICFKRRTRSRDQVCGPALSNGKPDGSF